MRKLAFLAAFIAFVSGASLQAAPAGPQPGPHLGYGDWHLACDNIATCEANALASGFQLDQQASLLIQRQAGQVGYFRVVVRLRDGDIARVALMIDGRKLAEGDVDNGERFIVPTADSMAVSRALAKGKRALVVNASEGSTREVLAQISLKGSAATLRRMDEEQGRARTSDAIVARGRRSYRGEAEVLPIITQMVPAQFKDLPGKKAMRKLAEESGCLEDRPDGFDALEEQAQPLAQTADEQVALVMVPCGFGAYNFSALPYIARRDRSDDDDDAPWRFEVAQFDYRPAWSENPEKPLLVNAYYNEEDGILGSFAKGRGLGDCGSGESYVWDGQMFRLFEASAMDECRGVWQWPTIWRAYVQRKPALP